MMRLGFANRSSTIWQPREATARPRLMADSPWRRVTRIAWDLLRLPVLAALLLCAPLVQAICGGALLLGITTSVIFEVSAVGPTFPFWNGIAISLGFGLLVPLCYAAIELLSRPHRS